MQQLKKLVIVHHEISGFQFGVSHTDAGRTSKADNNQWIVTYDFGVAKVGYAHDHMVQLLVNICRN